MGDLALLPPVDETPEVPEAAGEKAGKSASEPAAEAAPQTVAAVLAPEATAPARSGAFVWPDLAVLSAHGLNLKDFLDAVEGRLIDEALSRAEGVKNQAAELLGIKRTTLIEKLKKRNL